MNPKLEKTLEFAVEAHKGQFRKDNKTLYITHPIGVEEILELVTADSDVLCAALLHDVIEDTGFTYENIKARFGTRVANIVQEVTKDPEGNFHIQTEEGLMVKLADTLHNISTNPDRHYVLQKRGWLYKLL